MQQKLLSNRHDLCSREICSVPLFCSYDCQRTWCCLCKNALPWMFCPYKLVVETWMQTYIYDSIRSSGNHNSVLLHSTCKKLQDTWRALRLACVTKSSTRRNIAFQRTSMVWEAMQRATLQHGMVLVAIVHSMYGCGCRWKGFVMVSCSHLVGLLLSGREKGSNHLFYLQSIPKGVDTIWCLLSQLCGRHWWK